LESSIPEPYGASSCRNLPALDRRRPTLGELELVLADAESVEKRLKKAQLR
jgi:hypothetical protein